MVFALFIKKTIDIIEEGEAPIHHNPDYSGMGPTHSRNLQWIRCCLNGQMYSVINVHGLWNGQGKKDSPERLLQSQKIRAFIDALQTPIILCGDFNLRPDTESVKIIEKGMKNLIRLFNISSTRTSLYPKEEKFADYIFTSHEITVNHFAVLQDVVSDHCSLLLDFF